MINNFELIAPFIKPRDKDDFWHLQILRRKKENPDLGCNSELVRSYSVNNIEYLERKMPQIIELCRATNARACINLNRRSFEKCSLQMLRKLTEQILNKDFESAKSAYDSVCGAHSNEPNPKWIIDIDTKDFDVVTLRANIAKLMPYGEKWYTTIPSKQGMHIITSPFNISEFSKIYSGIDLHKNNPTNLILF